MASLGHANIKHVGKHWLRLVLWAVTSLTNISLASLSRLTRAPLISRWRKGSKSSIKPSRDDLVFLEESPDYCVRNSKTGSLGTAGRVCETTTLDNGNCAILCCERGFKTIQIEEEYQCACKFHWCCLVKCKVCRKIIDRHVCN